MMMLMHEFSAMVWRGVCMLLLSSARILLAVASFIDDEFEFVAVHKLWLPELGPNAPDTASDHDKGREGALLWLAHFARGGSDVPTPEQMLEMIGCAARLGLTDYQFEDYDFSHDNHARFVRNVIRGLALDELRRIVQERDTGEGY